MIALKSHAAALKKLRVQVNTLKRNEKVAQKKLRLALAKVKKIASNYEKKLIKKTKDIDVKVAAAEAAVYSKLAKSIKQQSKKAASLCKPKTKLKKLDGRK